MSTWDGKTIGLTKTAPVAYCGDYSCFQAAWQIGDVFADAHHYW